MPPFRNSGYSLVFNEQPDDRLAVSLRLGLKEAHGATHVLVCLADMPCITKRHIHILLKTMQTFPEQVIASRASDYRDPPVVLPAQVFDLVPERGERAGRFLLGDAISVTCDPKLLRDVDTLANLEGLRAAAN